MSAGVGLLLYSEQTDLLSSDQTCYMPNFMKQKFNLSLNKTDQYFNLIPMQNATIIETQEAISYNGNIVH